MKPEHWRIRVQADEFLKAYHVLKNGDHSTALMVATPGVVCLAFAVELYLKELHVIAAGKSPRGHNIYKLFVALPSDVRQAVFAHKSISDNPFMMRGDIFNVGFHSQTYTAYDRFTDQMKGISDGFEKWRYSYEVQTLTYQSSFALALITAVASTSDSKRI